MIETILFFLHSACLLLFGVYLSAIFSTEIFTRKKHILCLAISVISGLMQLIILILFSEQTVWYIYPLITHLPLFILLCVGFYRPWYSVLCAISTAYLCCQPSKWIGMLAASIGCSAAIEYLIRIIVLLLIGLLILRYAASSLRNIFSKDRRSVMIFGITPLIYYCFDYAYRIYPIVWLKNDQIALEFVSCFLSIIFLLFCVLYHNEYELKADAERKEQIIRLTVEEQAKELQMMEHSSMEMKILRHDLRLFLNQLSVSIENEDNETARKLIRSYIDSVEATTIVRYCANPSINYVLSSFAARCLEKIYRSIVMQNLTRCAVMKSCFPP